MGIACSSNSQTLPPAFHPFGQCRVNIPFGGWPYKSGNPALVLTSSSLRVERFFRGFLPRPFLFSLSLRLSAARTPRPIRLGSGACVLLLGFGCNPGGRRALQHPVSRVSSRPSSSGVIIFWLSCMVRLFCARVRARLAALVASYAVALAA